MLIRNHVPFKDIFQRNWRTFTAVVLYACLVSYLYENSEETLKHFLEIPSFIASSLGTSLAFFLGFITNSAYDRWWEARKRWGTIVNDSRNFAREVLTFIQSDKKEDQNTVKSLIFHQIAWCYSLKHQLRRQDPKASLQRILGNQIIQDYLSQNNPANAIMYRQGKVLKQFKENKNIDAFEAMQIDSTMNRLIDHMGANERIKNTIFPTQYSFFVYLFIILFLVMVPHASVVTMGWYSVPLTFVLAFVYLMIESIEISMQDPYDMEPSDTPMSAICRTIEIDLMQMMGEKKVPKPVLPVDGILH